MTVFYVICIARDLILLFLTPAWARHCSRENHGPISAVVYGNINQEFTQLK